ncbi:hypothetical protein SRHO_G00189620 [Serrasalmus rhombeus]
MTTEATIPVSAAAERTQKQMELKEMQREFQQRIQEKQKQLQELEQAVNTLKKINRMSAEELLEKLEQDIADLNRRNTELEQLSLTEDHIHFLQSLQSLSISSGSEDSSSISVHHHLSFDGVRSSLSDLKERLEEFCREEFSQIPPQAAAAPSFLSEPKSREDFLQYFCQLTLDPNTAHRHLILCICCLCTMDDHRGHDTVSAAAERTQKQTELKEMIQQRIQEKQEKLQELEQAVNTLKRSAQTAVEDTERIWTELICSMEKKRSELTELIRAQEKAELSAAEELLEKLEQEIADLKRRNTELEQLSLTEDHIHFLQSLQSLSVSSGSEDSSSISVHHHLSFDGVRSSLSDLKERLEEFCREEFRKIPPQAAAAPSFLSEPKSREDFLQYFCQLTLDPNTAHRRLILSEKNRALILSDEDQDYPDHPERFDYFECVLSFLRCPGIEGRTKALLTTG